MEQIGLKLINMRKLSLILALGLLFSCGDNKKSPEAPPVKDQLVVETPKVDVPHFSADSAYAFIAKQVSFGPRIPGTEAHEKTAAWLIDKLEEYCDSVAVQEAEFTTWDGKKVRGKNIQAFVQPNNPRRILLSAHWDTRPFSDEDMLHPKKTFDGADDGGSGVGVLLEMLRSIKYANEKPKVGLDIVFFDVEDWGNGDINDSYCLGSQYWARNYAGRFKPYFGMNLDMVGAFGAKFAKEGFSMQYALPFVAKIWNNAGKLGMSNYFIYEDVPAVIDDHYYVNKLAAIPTVNIINYNRYNGSSGGFGTHWHTQKDNMSVIDKATLHAVGTVVMDVVYHEF